MAKIWLLGKITFQEGLRNRILWGIFFFAFLLSIANYVFTQSFGYDLGKVSVDLGISAVSLAGLLIIFFMGINLISRDIEKRTVYMILARPITRSQYILGKFLGLALMVAASVVILGFFSFLAVAIKS